MESKYFYCFFYCFAFLSYLHNYSFLLFAINSRKNNDLGTTNKDNSLKFHFFFDVICLLWPSYSPDCLLLLLSENSIAISVFKHYLGLFFTKVTEFIYFAHNLKACLLFSITSGFLTSICKC